MTVMPSGSARSGMVASAAGGRSTWVSACRVTNAASSGPSRCSAGTTASAPPANRLIASSENIMSKLGEANWRCRVPGPVPTVRSQVRTSPVIPSCVLTTPLGVPVEPEV